MAKAEVMELSIYNLDGKTESQKLSVSKDIFGGKINRALLHDYVLWYLANARSGSANTKTKSEVRGGGRKPYQQKHTGRARRGSSRSPLISGGGVIFGPKPRDFGYSLTKSMKKAAMKSALSNKKENIVVLKELSLKEPKTKAMVKVIANFKLADPALFVDATLNENIVKAARNIRSIKTVDVKNFNTYDLLKYNKVFLTVEAAKKIEEKLSK